MCKTYSSTVRTVAIAKFSELYVLGAEPYRGTANCRTAPSARHWTQGTRLTAPEWCTRPVPGNFLLPKSR
jgi:hypothetical protein